MSDNINPIITSIPVIVNGQVLKKENFRMKPEAHKIFNTLCEGIDNKGAAYVLEYVFNFNHTEVNNDQELIAAAKNTWILDTLYGIEPVVDERGEDVEFVTSESRTPLSELQVSNSILCCSLRTPRHRINEQVKTQNPILEDVIEFFRLNFALHRDMPSVECENVRDF